MVILSYFLHMIYVNYVFFFTVIYACVCVRACLNVTIGAHRNGVGPLLPRVLTLRLPGVMAIAFTHPTLSLIRVLKFNI